MLEFEKGLFTGEPKKHQYIPPGTRMSVDNREPVDVPYGTDYLFDPTKPEEPGRNPVESNRDEGIVSDVYRGILLKVATCLGRIIQR